MGKYFKKSELVFAEKSKHCNFKDIEGKRYGRLTVMGFAGGRYWFCECDCGNVVKIYNGSLSSGATTSCGCYNTELIIQRRFKHGATSGGISPTYRSWTKLKHRCFNRNNIGYQDYGGRGITVCDRWKDSFENFLEDMGERPEGTSIDRIDNDGNYEPGNCRWATKKEQANNKRSNRYLTHDGKTLNLAQWSKKINISVSALYYRAFVKKWPTDDVLTVPFYGKRKN